jgi:hypothetical protein
VLVPEQPRACRFEQHASGQPVAAFRDRPRAVDFARLVAPGYYAERGAPVCGPLEAGGSIHGRGIGERGDRPHPWDGHPVWTGRDPAGQAGISRSNFLIACVTCCHHTRRESIASRTGSTPWTPAVTTRSTVRPFPFPRTIPHVFSHPQSWLDNVVRVETNGVRVAHKSRRV